MQKWNREALAWAAGFYDGEGCICVQQPSGVCLDIKIAQVDLRPLKRFLGAVCFGKIAGPYTRENRPKSKPFYYYRVNKWEDVQQVICCLWNWLSEPKKEQIVKCFKKVREKRVYTLNRNLV